MKKNDLQSQVSCEEDGKLVVGLYLPPSFYGYLYVCKIVAGK